MRDKEEPEGAVVSSENQNGSARLWQSLIASFWLPIVAVISECCFALMIGNRITVNMLLLAMSMLLFVSLLILLVPKTRFRVISTGIFTTLLAVIYIAQFIYYRIFSTIFIWASLQGSNAVIEYNGVVISAITKGWWGLLILMVPSVFYWSYGRKLIRSIPAKQKKYSITVASAFVAVTLLGTGLVVSDRKGAASPRRLYLTEFSQEASLRAFGLLP
ncbi:MAG: hypothetical protein IKM88_17910, partial [Lachnospiraceae bacterium]|nr:hypothetical protein [Lachnospiraceae bacterium]